MRICLGIRKYFLSMIIHAQHFRIRLLISFQLSQSSEVFQSSRSFNIFCLLVSAFGVCLWSVYLQLCEDSHRFDLEGRQPPSSGMVGSSHAGRIVCGGSYHLPCRQLLQTVCPECSLQDMSILNNAIHFCVKLANNFRPGS